jgi:hypothetical protein
MATYKVIQDIEAEDKFVGPLTLKQFVFAMGGALFAYLSFFIVTKGLAWGLIGTLPPAFFGFFMAVPWSSEQPTDVWVLAKIRFRIKPKKRIWHQAGMQELVTITAPKKEERPLTNNLSQTEVSSRLKALAETIDSRGWAIKNSSLQQPMAAMSQDTDRLVDTETLLQEQPPVPEADASIPDMMEEDHQLDSMMKQQAQTRKTQLYEKMDRIRQGETLESINQPEAIVSPPNESTPDEQALSDSLKAKRTAGDIARNNMRTIPAQPVATPAPAQDDGNDSAPPEQKTGVEKAQASMTEPASPDILGLARNNDLNVSTIARQAKSKDNKDRETNEVVISLH